MRKAKMEYELLLRYGFDLYQNLEYALRRIERENEDEPVVIKMELVRQAIVSECRKIRPAISSKHEEKDNGWLVTADSTNGTFQLMYNINCDTLQIIDTTLYWECYSVNEHHLKDGYDFHYPIQHLYSELSVRGINSKYHPYKLDDGTVVYHEVTLDRFNLSIDFNYPYFNRHNYGDIDRYDILHNIYKDFKTIEVIKSNLDLLTATI